MHRANRPAHRSVLGDGSAGSGDPDGAGAESRLLVELLPLAVVVVDRSGGVRSANQAARRLLLPPSGGTATIYDRVPGLAGAELHRRLSAAFAQNLPFLFPWVALPNVAGPRWLRTTLLPLSDAGAAPERAALTLEDITELADSTQHAETLDRAGERLGAAARERIEQLQDEFVSVASHELRTPLTTLLGYLYLLAQQTRQRGESHEAAHQSRLERIITIMQAQLLRLNRLVDDLVDVGRLQSGILPLRVDEIELSALVRRAIGEAALLGHGPPITLEATATTHFPVSGDSDRLEQVLVDLLQNAAAYADQSTQIVVRLQRVEHPGARSAVEVAIQDHGPGIAPAAQAAIFAPFFQIDPRNRRSRTGLGLGLYLARQLVEQHGGSLTLASEVGRGSTFTVALPLAEPAA